MNDTKAACDVLLRAMARARLLRGRTILIKLGGSAMEDPIATRGTLESVVALQSMGIRLILVHGGGKPIDRAMAAAGLVPKKVAGRRYTDDATLEIVVRTLCEEINPSIVATIRELGGRADGITANRTFPIRGETLTLDGVDLGHVGQPTRVETANLQDLIADGRIPVLPSLAVRGDGRWLNVNADTIASAVAGAVSADSAIFLTDTPGVLQNRNDPDSLLACLSAAECRDLIRRGIIAGGMIPKVEACLDALREGAGRAVILDGRNPYSLLHDFVSDRPYGTEIVP